MKKNEVEIYRGFYIGKPELTEDGTDRWITCVAKEDTVHQFIFGDTYNQCITQARVFIDEHISANYKELPVICYVGICGFVLCLIMGVLKLVRMFLL